MYSGLYPGTVAHRRLRPRPHAFRYQVTAWYLDLDELPQLDRELPGFGWNRVAPISFHDCDHGSRDGGPLRPHVERTLARHGIAAPARIGLLCYPRMLGYTFNPLSVYYCFDADDRLIATLHEVSNTFGQTHTYLVGDSGIGTGPRQQVASKNFYVSPFMPMQCTYRFRLQPPGEGPKLSIGIRQYDSDGPLFNAVFVGHHRPLEPTSVLRLLATRPLMTFKIMVAIHYEAARLWLKRIPLVTRPPAPDREITLGQTLMTNTLEETGQ